jgi:periplasmic divalent cation tolerance protein
VDDLCQVTITAPDAEWLAAFVHELVDGGLCSSGHITPAIRSVYRWQGETHDRTEAHVTLHTRRSCVDAITELTLSRHPYQVPCVVASPIVGGNPAYLDWIREETQPV